MASALPVDCAMKTLSLEADDGVIQAEHVVGCESSSGSSSPTTSEASEDSLERVRFSRCSVRDSTVSEDDDELEKNDTNAEDVLTIPRTAHEVLYAELEPPSIPDATLVRPEYQLHRLGTLVAFVDGLVVVESAPSVCAGVVGSLGEGSLLCFADRQPLGFVFEIFGAVQRPLYVVRIHPQDEAVRGSLQTGCDVFYVDELCQPLRLEFELKTGM
ncbi:H/ACA ribonucleoprotein complex non-core subunit naf1 [Cyanidiococcus yangmingshanensis]|uniref:H/ACA ribonucleoprotein complex subunit n=1 Tax=Cyanidiococcus yangmingshanensis TaxID=2690220 RepID=A0A7J7ID72_9RHOD|nr:H/ACA ribonucleoprotein complex non-core subunit naf1 [Cyanidiococcus yangmingshanensis]